VRQSFTLIEGMNRLLKPQRLRNKVPLGRVVAISDFFLSASPVTAYWAFAPRRALSGAPILRSRTGTAEILISVAAGDALLHQADRRMPALPGPEEPAVGGQNPAIVFQGEREIHAIP
jgi:hypothetical protein